MHFWIRILATGGVGFSPIMPGTLGTLLGIPLFLVLSDLPWYLFWLTVVAFTVFAVWVSEQALPTFAAGTKKKEDPSHIIIDEVAGFLWAAGILSHLGVWDPSEGRASFLAIAFFWFRFFDIVKWGPIGWAERKFKGGVGVVMDDVVAGIVAGFAGILFCIVYPFVIYLGLSIWNWFS